MLPWFQRFFARRKEREARRKSLWNQGKLMSEITLKIDTKARTASCAPLIEYINTMFLVILSASVKID
jgi:hypothetical protein